jgi:transcription initiation factor IIE alpha subunit
MNKPMTLKQAREKHGKDVWDDTCSAQCPRCEVRMFFTGRVFKEAIPEEFICENCGSKSKPKRG